MSKLVRKLDNPETDDFRINSSDYFELVYLRHRYFRKSQNPSPGRLEQFEEMLCNIANKVYIRNIALFKTVGFEIEDMRNIARVHTVSFIHMSGLKENPELMENFTVQHKKKYGEESEPGKMDIFRKEAYNLARFLDQRLTEVARFSRNKSKNIRGTVSEKLFFVGDPLANPTDDELYYSPETYGYKKITEVDWKKITETNDEKGNRNFIDNGGKRVRAVYIQGSFLKYQDIEDTYMDPGSSSFYRTPEENLILKENYAEMDNKSLYKKEF